MPLKVAVICIGTELLSGRTLNSNILYLGQELTKLGLTLDFSPVVKDEKVLLRETISYCLHQYDIVITGGGLGPTSDDITKEVVAAYYNEPLIIDEDVWKAIQNRFPGKVIPQINRKQAERPECFHVLENKVGSAPGLYCIKEGKLLILLPGVPNEMKHIFSERVKPLLRQLYNLPPINIKTIHTIDIPESSLAEMISDIPVAEGIELAFLPQTGKVDLRLIGHSQDEVTGLFLALMERVKDYVWGIDDETLPLKVHKLLIEKSMTLAVAESCTGGMIQQLLTAIPEASQYLQGGMVVYSNESKINVLGVSPSVVAKQGAVSEETAAEMALCIRDKFQADIGLSITGIAGPGGGTESKPVGTVCFGIALKDNVRTYRKRFTGDREIVRDKAAYYLLYLISMLLLKNE